MVAVVILAWVLAMNAKMAETTLRADQHARCSMAAAHIALGKAEQLRRAGYNQLARSGYEDREVREGVAFRLQAGVQDSAIPGLAELRIVVNWEKGAAIRGSQSFHTLLRKQ